MIRSNLRISIRNILHHKFYSFINIAGLAVGIACVLFILFFIQDEVSYDKFNEKAERIYRVNANLRFQGNDLNAADVGPTVGRTLVKDYPEVETYTRIMNSGTFFVEYNNISFKEPDVYYSDSTFFDVFSIQLITGNPKSVLTAPYSIILSEKIAQKYFGNEDPIGKVLRLDDREDYNVTGIFKEIPTNCHFHTNLIASLSSNKGSSREIWLGNMNYSTYIVLNKEADYKKLEAKFPELLVKYVGPMLEKFLNISLEDFTNAGNKVGYSLQPLTDIHLYSNLAGELEPNSDIQYVYIFSAIGLFILLLACVNFINLSTARASNRAKEVGIKKVVGSDRKNLIIQFLTESTVISIISIIFAVILVQLFLPQFNTLAGKQIETSYLENFFVVVSLVIIAIITGLLAGSFPAFVLSAFNPVTVLKGNLSTGVKKGWFRSSLIIFQFATSIILIIGTIVIFNQLNYIQNKKLGFNKDHVLIVNDAFILGDKAETFKEEVLNNPEIIKGTITGYLPVSSHRSSNGTFPDGNVNSPDIRPIQNWRVDHDFISTMGIELVEGRDFSREFRSDSSAVIINEACVKHFEFDNPLEHTVGWFVGDPPNPINYQIIGVVKDFHFESLKRNIEPVAMYIRRSTSSVSFRINSANITALIESVKSKWEEFVPGQPFSYKFMDESFNDMYSAERKISEIITVFAFLAILVACLGLFGLSAYTAERKTKEIGIRKVLGASVSNIVVLLSMEFAKLVSISLLVAAPIAYFIMNSWLQDYAYRTEISFWTFIISGTLALSVAVITVIFNALKAAMANPAKSLKYE
ncbi:ABC transporter permease [Bacteroidota bacterium]